MNKSTNDKIWRQKDLDEHYISELVRNFGISDLLAKLLSFRVKTLDKSVNFLYPKIKNSLPDPFSLLDMDKGVERVIKALEQKEKICIFADYDVDGSTSSALLKNIFRDLGHIVDIYVPDRILEGYGPSNIGIDRIKNSGASLIITVDCGVTAHEPLLHAKNLGIDVIIIDHHLGASLPEAVAIINPNRLDEKSEYKYLAAVGVAFLFAVGIVSKLKLNGYFEDTKAPDLMKYLDIVALGTVCDMMPIIDLNRVIVAQGLKIMLQRQNIGIKALLDIARIEEKPSTYHLGFVLGPRINAGGRVGKSYLGAHLLSTTSEIEASAFAQELEQHNNERKIIESMILEEAIEIAEQQKDYNCLFIVGFSWHVGVIGIIAGRLKEKFNKPVAVIAVNDGIAKASCRSVKGIDFGSALLEAKMRELIIVGGGHAMAAGFTAKEEQLPLLQNFLNEYLVSHNNEDRSIAEYDIELTANSLNDDLLDEIAKLEPYGIGNPEPIFKIQDLFILKANIVGGKHISCLLVQNKDAKIISSDIKQPKPISSIVFNGVGAPLERVLLSSKPLNLTVFGLLKRNNWNGNSRIQLHIIDALVQ